MITNRNGSAFFAGYETGSMEEDVGRSRALPWSRLRLDQALHHLALEAAVALGRPGP